MHETEAIYIEPVQFRSQGSPNVRPTEGSPEAVTCVYVAPGKIRESCATSLHNNRGS
jgi:hypothetical protein